MFALIAGTLTVVFAALASVRNHIPRHIGQRAAPAADHVARAAAATTSSLER
jgi:hypothetical protein